MTDTPEMIRQRAYRARRTAKLVRLEAALREVDELLASRTSALSTQVRTLIQEALS